MTAHTYDRIGRSYSRNRRADPRIAAQIRAAVGDVISVLDVGAGTGSYELSLRGVIAVEPSRVMIAQRSAAAAPAAQAVAEALPFDDQRFDAAIAILTVHHWRHFARGIDEMRRVSRHRVVVLTWDPEVFAARFWFARDYLPEALEAEAKRNVATVDDVVAALGRCRLEAVPVPHDCADGFFGAYWRRPAAYLDPEVRTCISACAELGEDTVRPAVERLAADLSSGAWGRRYGDLLALDAIDLGYRLVIWSR